MYFSKDIEEFVQIETKGVRLCVKCISDADSPERDAHLTIGKEYAVMIMTKSEFKAYPYRLKIKDDVGNVFCFPSEYFDHPAWGYSLEERIKIRQRLINS